MYLKNNVTSYELLKSHTKSRQVQLLNRSRRNSSEDDFENLNSDVRILKI